MLPGPTDGERPEALAAELEARPGGPQAIPHGNLHTVFRGQPGKLVAAGHLERERVHVLLGVGEDFAFAGRTGRGVHAHDFGGLHAKQGQGIAVAQVGHVRKGQTADIIKRLDVLAAGNARGGELGAVLGLFMACCTDHRMPASVVFGKGIGGRVGRKRGLAGDMASLRQGAATGLPVVFSTVNG